MESQQQTADSSSSSSNGYLGCGSEMMTGNGGEMMRANKMQEIWLSY